MGVLILYSAVPAAFLTSENDNCSRKGNYYFHKSKIILILKNMQTDGPGLLFVRERTQEYLFFYCIFAILYFCNGFLCYSAGYVEILQL